MLIQSDAKSPPNPSAKISNRPVLFLERYFKKDLQDPSSGFSNLQSPHISTSPPVEETSQKTSLISDHHCVFFVQVVQISSRISGFTGLFTWFSRTLIDPLRIRPRRVELPRRVGLGRPTHTVLKTDRDW